MTGVSPIALGYSRWLGRHARSVLLSSLALACIAATSLVRLEFDIGLVSMLPSGSQEFQQYGRFVDRFGTRDMVVALVTASDPVDARRFALELAEELEASAEILEVHARMDPSVLLKDLMSGALPRLLPLDRYEQIEERLRPETVRSAVGGIKRALSVPGVAGVESLMARDP